MSRDPHLRDDLTGLYNRRAFLMLAEQEHRALQRRGNPAALLAVSINNLEGIAEEHGRDEVEALVVAVGDLLRVTVRGADIAARVGRGEFAVLALDCEDAEALRRRLREHVAEYNGMFPRPYKFTVAVGIGTVEADPARPVESQLERAARRTH